LATIRDDDAPSGDVTARRVTEPHGTTGVDAIEAQVRRLGVTRSSLRARAPPPCAREWPQSSARAAPRAASLRPTG